MSTQRRWRSSERIALRVLEELGYKIIETKKVVKIRGVDVCEIDAIVEEESGVKYAVEIKAGKIDVSGIRQAYVNAALLGLKPLIISKGFADRSAEELAKELGVKVIELSDYFLIEAEELELIVRSSIESIIDEALSTIVELQNPSPSDLEFLKNIAKAHTVPELARDLNASINEVIDRIKDLQAKKVLPKTTKSYRILRTYAQIVILMSNLRNSLEQLNAILRELLERK
ncbi:MAG: restriction endonuclease [Sulfolobales archaeon]|nr:restriction endonuclease [Sulfolobales archaeon]MCX8198756.1 restriction endonuclease [Sulfolobales archaeon]MDW8169829.1 restriction endonuclease [Desulfurococcaceae archaeon]